MTAVGKVRTLPRASVVVDSWNTSVVPPQERQEYWRLAMDAVSAGSLQLQSGGGGRGMTGSIRKVSLPDVHLAHVRGSSQRLACQPGSRCPLMVVVDAEHEWEVLADGLAQPVRAGQVAIVPAAAGTALDFRHGMNAVLLAASKAWGQRWLLAADAPPRVCDSDRGWGRILATMMRELAQEPEAAARESGATVADMLGFMLAAARRTEAAPRFAVDLVDEARRLCRERLADSDLHAQVIAETLGVSVRTLSRAFQEAGSTFAESVREMRMQQAAALLAQPELAHLGVAEVGQQCGFVSASHFVREFRRHWGHTPGQTRAGSAARQARTEIICRTQQVLAEARTRIEAQKARITQMQAAQSLELPAAVDLLRTLEDSLAALERMRDAAERTR